MEDTIKVLLVEDIKIAQIAATLVLRSLNFSVDVADTGLQALERITQNYYPIIFMDIGLPDDLDGFMVTEKIRNTENPNKNSIIVALTAHDEESYVQKSIQSGMNDFLVKPLTVDKVKNMLSSQQQTLIERVDFKF